MLLVTLSAMLLMVFSLCTSCIIYITIVVFLRLVIGTIIYLAELNPLKTRKMRHAICYVSNSNADLNDDQINSQLNFWKEKNESNDIKGVLLYSEGNFFQIIEGPKHKVLSLFEKIEKDSRHHGIIKVVDRDISQGSLDGYKVDVLSEAHKVNYEVPLRYYEALKGIPDRVKKPMERMLQMFIATR